jgi:ATP-dependent DNA ligase
VQVSFIEWTVHGKLRHSRLIAVRIDKDARHVVRESVGTHGAGVRANSARDSK